MTDVADAIVAVTAMALRAGVVTGDPGDLRRIAGALGRNLGLVVV